MKDAIPQTNCYCGQNEVQKMNMLYCVKCRRWLHEECVKCLNKPILHGDRFYILICSVCNAGTEFLARIELTWIELLHLVLYTLTTQHNKKYFDLDESILPYICDNWNRFYVFGSVASVKRKEERKIKILEAFDEDGGKRFKNGREIKKSKNIFGLRVRVPPEPPAIQPLSAKLHKDRVVWEFKVKGRLYEILSKKSKETSKTDKVRSKSSSTNKNSEQLLMPLNKGNGSENSNHKTKNKTKSTSKIPFNEKSAQRGLLDSLIPKTNLGNLFWEPYHKLHSSAHRRKCTRPQSVNLLPPTKKRRLNGDLKRASSSSNHKKLRRLESEETTFNAKEYIRHSQYSARPEDSFCVVGKRVTRRGKTQYLFQKNRTHVENVAPMQKTPCTIWYCCKCRTCRILNKLRD